MAAIQIEIDKDSGFCFGVTTAIKKAEEELANSKKLYCLGDIVHNGMECDRLHAMGLETIEHEQMKSIRHAKVLLRAHGEADEKHPPRQGALACPWRAAGDLCHGEKQRHRNH